MNAMVPSLLRARARLAQLHDRRRFLPSPRLPRFRRSRRRPGRFTLAERHRTPPCGCSLDRAADRCCSVALRFSLILAGKPTGVPPAIPAFHHVSIFPNPDNVEAVTVLWPAPTKFDDGAGGFSLGYHDQVVLPLRIVPKSQRQAGHASRRHQLRGVREDLHSGRSEHGADFRERRQHRRQRPVRSARYRSRSRRRRRSQPAHHPRRQARGQIDGSGRRALARCDETVNLFVEGPTPDWALPVPKLLDHGPAGVKRFAFELDGVPPGTNPEGAALKLTLVGGDRSYEFNINLE